MNAGHSGELVMPSQNCRVAKNCTFWCSLGISTVSPGKRNRLLSRPACAAIGAAGESMFIGRQRVETEPQIAARCGDRRSQLAAHDQETCEQFVRPRHL